MPGMEKVMSACLGIPQRPELYGSGEVKDSRIQRHDETSWGRWYGTAKDGDIHLENKESSSTILVSTTNVPNNRGTRSGSTDLSG